MIYRSRLSAMMTLGVHQRRESSWIVLSFRSHWNFGVGYAFPNIVCLSRSKENRR